MSDESVPRPVAATIYRNGVVLWYPARPAAGGGVREEVSFFSSRSRRRLAFAVQNCEGSLTHMTTLTYPRHYPPDGRRVKSHLNRILSWMRARHAATCGTLEYVWWLEFQRRGAPHFHILHNYPAWTRQELSQRWYDAVGSLDARHLSAGTRMEKLREVDGAARYATKYATKAEQKAVPTGYENVGRFWGMSRNIRPVARASYLLQDGDDALSPFDGWVYRERLDSCAYKMLFGAAATFDSDGLTKVDLETGEITE